MQNDNDTTPPIQSHLPIFFARSDPSSPEVKVRVVRKRKQRSLTLFRVDAAKLCYTNLSAQESKHNHSLLKLDSYTALLLRQSPIAGRSSASPTAAIGYAPLSAVTDLLLRTKTLPAAFPPLNRPSITSCREKNQDVGIRSRASTTHPARGQHRVHCDGAELRLDRSPVLCRSGTSPTAHFPR